VLEHEVGLAAGDDECGRHTQQIRGLAVADVAVDQRDVLAVVN